MAKKNPLKTEPSARPLIALITLAYTVIAAGVVLVIVLTGAPLLDGDVWFRWPSIWLWIVYGIYYVLPVVLAVAYGLALRPPFWTRVRDLLVSILLVQLVYSVGVHLWRVAYLQRMDEAVYRTKRAEPFVYEAKHKLVDKDKDGEVEEIKCRVKIDLDEYPDGKYAVEAYISQADRPLSRRGIGSSELVLTEEGGRDPTLLYSFDPRTHAPYYRAGPFFLGVKINRMFVKDREGRVLTALARWSPYFRSTRWDGYDPRINRHLDPVAEVDRIDSFSLVPLDASRPRVTLMEYVKDFGRDTNGNNLFDELVIELNVFSRYEGKAFLQALVEGAPYPVIQEVALKEGENHLEYVIPARDVRAFGVETPFHLTEVQIYNRDPHCQEGECLKQIKPRFKYFLEGYLTKEYSILQFDPH